MSGTVSVKIVGALVILLAVSVVSARELSFDERVAAQKAIEHVYWSHRIWPKENPGPKPPLSAVMPDTAIRAKVEDYLKKSNALEKWWLRPVTADQLQAELDRMAKNTRDGAMLQELFAALGNDPQLIAETLARPSLVERLIRNWYSSDTRFHGELKAKAKAARALCAATECMKAMGGEYLESTWKRRVDPTNDTKDVEAAIRLDDAEWATHIERLARTMRTSTDALPAGALSALEETPEAFVITAVLAKRETGIKTAVVVWRKRSFDLWWSAEQVALSRQLVPSSGGFELPDAAPMACVNDAWAPTRVEVPDSAMWHSAVWTGTEMIVWGGFNDGNFFDTGGRYSPSTDTWVLVSRANAPSARAQHSAVWTGTRMIVWGGYDGPNKLATGGRYDPSTDTWASTSSGANLPEARSVHTAVWTGTEMIVWGGEGVSPLNTGGRYNPSTDSWSPTSTGTNVPVARWKHTAVWTGTEMIVWGGYGPTYINTGARYNPSTDTWMPTSTGVGVPSSRLFHTAVWTGSEMIIWGGEDGPGLNSGGRYNPASDSWIATSTGANLPGGRSEHSAIWTGSEMIVWGGNDFSHTRLSSGGRYNPSTNSWLPTSTGLNAPDGRYRHTAVWTGNEMVVWGGQTNSQWWGLAGRYNPASDSWSTVSTGATVPVARAAHAAVWTGTEMIVWGGAREVEVNSGGRYVPATDSWTPTSTGTNVPTARTEASAIWTGTVMIIWGGQTSIDPDSGALYNPSSNTWAPMTETNVPLPSYQPSTVWTGSEMIVWGGIGGSYLNTGARYNPSADTWTATSTGANVPAGRFRHSAVWTGTEMIVWGGSTSFNVLTNTGGRYDPSTNTWTATSTGLNTPAVRESHTAVWTGTEMIVWGGVDISGSGEAINTGGRYNRSSNSWMPTSTGANVPAPRPNHTAVWTGSEMVVWGGWVNTGARYNSSTDGWTSTSTGPNVPVARVYHSAIWTGSQMIVWGGVPGTSTGGLYCACINGHLYYRDADGDGHGDAANALFACEGSVPSGYAADLTDCDDADAHRYAGAPEINDGLDNQCAGDPGYGVIDEISGVSGFLTTSSKTLFSWPAQTGATNYDVARSPFGDFHAGCVHTTTASASWTDPTTPAPGAAFYYLVRAVSPHIGSWGQRRPAAERTVCAGCVSTGDWCDDGNACTSGDSCTGSTCVPGSSLNCDDGNVCTTDSCNPVPGCAHANNTLACNDGNICTSGDVCQSGICAGTLPTGADHLVISQIQLDGDGATPAEDEFVEIYNPTSAPISLNAHSLQYKTNSGSQTYFKHSFGGTASVPAHGWFLVARSSYNNVAVPPDEVNGAFPMGTTVGSVFLVSDDVLLSGACSASGTILDKVGYGTGNCPEGSPVAFPSANNSILRKPGGACGNGTDTDSNPADFTSQSPSTPRNSSSTPQP